MFFNKPGKATKLKKIVYLSAATLLGLLLCFIAHAIIEINYLHWALIKHQTITFYGNCALNPLLQVALWIIGAVGGFMLGEFWWRKVYVERSWIKKIWHHKK